MDETVEVFRDEHADYASNVIPRTYPRGLDTEVFTFAALDRAWREAREPHQREHVTPYLYEHPQIFQAGLTERRRGLQPLSLDPGYARGPGTAARDLLPLRRPRRFLLAGSHSLMEREPELAELNSQVLQKTVREH